MGLDGVDVGGFRGEVGIRVRRIGRGDHGGAIAIEGIAGDSDIVRGLAPGNGDVRG